MYTAPPTSLQTSLLQRYFACSVTNLLVFSAFSCTILSDICKTSGSPELTESVPLSEVYYTDFSRLVLFSPSAFTLILFTTGTSSSSNYLPASVIHKQDIVSTAWCLTSAQWTISKSISNRRIRHCTQCPFTSIMLSIHQRSTWSVRTKNVTLRHTALIAKLRIYHQDTPCILCQIPIQP